MNLKHLLIVSAVVCGLVTACSEKQELTEVPTQGKMEYEIHYSSSLRNNVVFGFALPKKLSGIYNEYGVKMSIQSALSFIKCDMICSTDESFMTMRVDDTKFILSLNDFVENVFNIQNTDSAANVIYSDKTEKIGGWMSNKIMMRYKSSLFEDSVNVEMFYVPVQFEREFTFVKNSQITKLPGLITAMTISSGENDIMIVLKDLEQAVISKEEFSQPTDYRQATIAQIDSLVRSFL